MTSMLLGIGVFGILGLSVLCPIVAWPGYYFRNRKTSAQDSQDDRLSTSLSLIEIIIPAHNEADLIGTTLESLQCSIQQFQTVSRAALMPNIVIRVGADACTDQTTKIARQFPLVFVTEFSEKRSKWATIKALMTDSSADWVFLVDAGTIWPANLLGDFVRRIESEPQVIAVAPSYRPLKAGLLHRILWTIEMGLKRIEVSCGGPISLHGATVGYRTDLLKKALVYLGDTLWLNDDVVIPLALRALHPEGLVLYPVGQVQDVGSRNDQLDLGRRKRMLLGNLQWVAALLPVCFRLNPIAALVATRRLFRILWAYWLAFILFGLTWSFHLPVWPEFVVAGVLIVLSGSFRQLAGAAWVSLLAPFRIIRLNWALGGSWK